MARSSGQALNLLIRTQRMIRDRKQMTLINTDQKEEKNRIHRGVLDSVSSRPLVPSAVKSSVLIRVDRRHRRLFCFSYVSHKLTSCCRSLLRLATY